MIPCLMAKLIDWHIKEIEKIWSTQRTIWFNKECQLQLKQKTRETLCTWQKSLENSNILRKDFWCSSRVGIYNLDKKKEISGWKSKHRREKKSALIITAAVARKLEFSCCSIAVQRPVPMIQSDWYPGDYNNSRYNIWSHIWWQN